MRSDMSLEIFLAVGNYHIGRQGLDHEEAESSLPHWASEKLVNLSFLYPVDEISNFLLKMNKKISGAGSASEERYFET